MTLPTTTKYVFLQPSNGFTCFSCFSSDKKEIDTFFSHDSQNDVFKRLSKLDIILITCEKQAIKLELDIYED